MAIRVPFDAHEIGEGDERQIDLTQIADVRFEELWEHRAVLRELCQRIVGDAATADDVVQETYLRALRNLDRLERRPSLVPWLATVARRRSIDELRRRRYATPVEVTPEDSTRLGVDPADSAAVNDTVERVRQALTQLTDRERELLVRQVNQGLSLAELADEEHTSVASVRSVLARARTKLRAALADQTVPVLGPFVAAGQWARRRLAGLTARLQQASPVLPLGYDRLGEVLTAGVAAAALAIGGAPVGASFTHVASPAIAAAGPAAGAAASTPAPPVTPDGAPGGRRTAQASAAPVPRDAAVPLLPFDPLQPGGQGAVRQPEDVDVRQFAASAPRSGGRPIVFLTGWKRGCATNCVVLFRSDDAGASWHKLDAAGLGGTALLVPPDFGPGPGQDHRLYAMADPGLQVSNDGGRSFQAVPTAALGSEPFAMSPGFDTGDDRILIGSTPSWTYEATTGAAVPLTTVPSGGPVNHFSFASDYVTSGRLFVGTLDPTGPVVYRCKNQAASRTATDVCTDKAALPGISAPPRVWSSSTFAADGIVLAWADGGMFRSGDGGATFERVDPGYQHIATITDDGAGNFYAAGWSDTARGSVGGVLASSDGGRTWRMLGAGTPLVGGATAVLALPGGRLLAAPLTSAGGGVLCSMDSGATWTGRCGR